MKKDFRIDFGDCGLAALIAGTVTILPTFQRQGGWRARPIHRRQRGDRLDIRPLGTSAPSRFGLTSRQNCLRDGPRHDGQGQGSTHRHGGSQDRPPRRNARTASTALSPPERERNSTRRRIDAHFRAPRSATQSRSQPGSRPEVVNRRRQPGLSADRHQCRHQFSRAPAAPEARGRSLICSTRSRAVRHGRRNTARFSAVVLGPRRSTSCRCRGR